MRPSVVAGLAVIVGLALVIVLQAVQVARARAAAQDAERKAEILSDESRALASSLIFDVHDSIVKLDRSLPARQLLLTEARDYLEELRAGGDDTPELARDLGMAYDRLGDVLGGFRNPRLGDTTAALDNYHIALELHQFALDATPGDDELMNEMAGTHIRIGDMERRMGRRAEALTSYRRGLEIREELVGTYPKYRRLLCLALNAMGDALNGIGQLDEALAHYHRALDLARQLASERSDNLLLRNLSVALGRVGDMHRQFGWYEKALPLREEALEIRERLLEAEPWSSRARRDVAIAHYFVANLLLLLRQPWDAAPHVGTFLAMAEQRAADNPESARAKRDLAAAFGVDGRRLAMTEHWAAAHESYRRFHEHALSLTERDPADFHYRALVGESHGRLGDIAKGRGEWPGAVEQYQRAVKLYQRMVEDDPNDFYWRMDHANASTDLGAALAETGDNDRSMVHLATAEETYRSELATSARLVDAAIGLAEVLHVRSRLSADQGIIVEAVLLAEEALDTLGEFDAGEAEELRAAINEDLARFHE